jgi:Alkylmercury lyase
MCAIDALGMAGMLGASVAIRSADPFTGEPVADARHSWLDALSSAGALAGLVAVTLGFRRGTRSRASQ